MTEKRFYYNTFYRRDDMSRVLEYEIIDRQSYPNYPNHDEKEDLAGWYIYITENDSGWQDMLINLLNQLNDANEQLEKSKMEIANDLGKVIDENEQLKEDRNELFIRERNARNDWRKLKYENEQLKKKIKSLEDANEGLIETIAHGELEE